MTDDSQTLTDIEFQEAESPNKNELYNVEHSLPVRSKHISSQGKIINFGMFIFYK